MKRIVTWGVLVLLLGAFAVLPFAWPKGLHAPPIPSPNGYTGLLNAVSQLKGVPPNGGDGDEASFVKDNQLAFQAVQAALKLQCELPLANYSQTNLPLNDLGRLKTLAVALRVKAAQDEKCDAWHEASEGYLDVIRLGQKVEHGPIISMLVGVAIERIGLSGLEKLAPRLPAGEQQQVRNELSALNTRRLPYDEVAMRESYFAHRNTSNPLQILVARYQSRKAMNKAKDKHAQISREFEKVSKEIPAEER